MSVQLRQNLRAVEVDGGPGVALAEMHEGDRTSVEDGLDRCDKGRGVGAGGPPGDHLFYRVRLSGALDGDRVGLVNRTGGESPQFRGGGDFVLIAHDGEQFHPLAQCARIPT